MTCVKYSNERNMKDRKYREMVCIRKAAPESPDSCLGLGAAFSYIISLLTYPYWQLSVTIDCRVASYTIPVCGSDTDN
jgi:hypothetical protein